MESDGPMNTFRLLAAFASVFVLVGCTDMGKEPVLEYTLTIEDYETSPFQFPSGVYFSYANPDLQSSDFDADAALRNAVAQGLRIQDSWYKSYSANCTLPGGTHISPVVVEGCLLVRAALPAPGVRTVGFVETSEPNIGSCAYRVRHYHFQQ
jgi:hypothetical protein